MFMLSLKGKCGCTAEVKFSCENLTDCLACDLCPTFAIMNLWVCLVKKKNGLVVVLVACWRCDALVESDPTD